ncbi:MAG: tetratricopeptide repeat protein [Cyclobacteriaceae bacterium]|nr:tetratricopeptide repeat protein [Cyclobacteriaceae bacterium]MCH8515088.1 tetratricopeptide repeat protein [Cyclobacteriaceae bacterium]
MEKYPNREERELVKRFERFLSGKGEHCLFDLESYESIIGYYLDAFNFKKALSACEMAEEKYPFEVDLSVLKAQSHVGLEQYHEALEILGKAENLRPFDSEIIFLKGNITALLGDYKAAIQLYERLFPMVDDKDEVYYFMGVAYQAGNKFEDAIKCFKQVLEININHESALYDLAFCFDMIGKQEESLSYYQDFIDKDPYSSQAWYNIGIVYNKLGKYKEAIQSYDYATTIQEDFSSAWFNMGNTYMNLLSYNKALNAYTKALEIEGHSSEVLCCIGAAYEKMEQYDLGIKYYRLSSKDDPENDEAWFGMACCLDAKQKWHEGIHAINKAIKLADDVTEYWVLKGRMEHQIGNLVSALQAYEEASYLGMGDMPSMWLDWSKIYFEIGEISRAIEIIDLGIADLPEESDLYYRKVAYLIEQGDYKNAFAILENALTLNYENHTQLFSFFPKLETQKALYKIIQKYKS